MTKGYGMLACSVAVAILLACASPSFGEDPNEVAGGETVPPGPPTITETVTLTFPGPLSSYQIDLYIANGTSGSINSVSLDGSGMSPYPILWDSFGTFGGPATLQSLTGEDTYVVTATFLGFDSGETVSFTGIDPDFDGGPAGVMIGELAGVACTVTGPGSSGSGVFAVVGNDVVATITLVPTATEDGTWGAVKALFR